jgi:hypothetical protein
MSKKETRFGNIPKYDNIPDISNYSLVAMNDHGDMVRLDGLKLNRILGFFNEVEVRDIVLTTLNPEDNGQIIGTVFETEDLGLITESILLEDSTENVEDLGFITDPVGA